MTRNTFWLLCLLPLLVSAPGTVTLAQEEPRIHVVVNMVQLNVAVTDDKGNYVTGLKPQDFVVTEDGIRETLATFAEGNNPTRRLVAPWVAPENPVDALNDSGAAPGAPPQNLDSAGMATLASGANVFILFDTSNYMYRGFVFAQDAIADFIRSLDNPNRVALYSYSRDLSRVAMLTDDRAQVLRSVRSTVAGDDAALYNSLLLTVKDASRYTGKKIVVVFSNGPDNSSVVPPEDVAELAQSTGTVIYMISTQQAKLEPVSTAVFERMTAATGGKAYFAKTWRDEQKAFTLIRDDLDHLYSLSYYPQANPNMGWRAISVRLAASKKKYHIRTRNGYRPEPAESRPRNTASAD